MTPGMLQQQQQQQQSQTQPLAPMMGNRGFNIAHQKVGLEVDLAGKSLRGWTEITINPTDPSLKTIRLNSRQCGRFWRYSLGVQGGFADAPQMW